MPKKKAFLLRMQPELWEEVSRWAADELRSVNGHIEFLLRDAVRKHRRGAAAGEGTAGADGSDAGGSGAGDADAGGAGGAEGPGEES